MGYKMTIDPKDIPKIWQEYDNILNKYAEKIYNRWSDRTRKRYIIKKIRLDLSCKSVQSLEKRINELLK